jgi:hypothetical protein
MELINNKRGFSTLSLIVVIFVAFFIMVFATITSYAFGTADDALTQIVGTIGNDSFQEVYQDTLQKGIISMETTVPRIVSTTVLLGMVMAMMLVGWNIKKLHQIWIIIDIIIIIIAEILASIITSNFTIFINSNDAFLVIGRDILPLGSKFILNLVVIIPTVGILIMLATYYISKDKEERPFTA